jgi:hypothetical protein
MYHPSRKCIINGTSESWISHLTARVVSSEYPEALQSEIFFTRLTAFEPQVFRLGKELLGLQTAGVLKLLDTHLVVSTFIAHHAETIPYIS